MRKIIERLRSVEREADQTVKQEEIKAEKDIAKTKETTTVDFDRLQLELEKDRTSKLQDAERDVAGEIEKIESEGKKQQDKLDTAAKQKEKQLKTRISETLFGK